MLTLAHAAQIINVSGEAVYHGLWEYFVQAILQYRIAPYFPQLTHPIVAQHPSWKSSSTSSASASERNTDLVVLQGKSLSTCAYIVQYLRALTAQPARVKHTLPRESLYSDPTALRGFFKLIAQYVLLYGEGIEAEDLEDLEDACGLFRKKTTSMEVRSCVLLQFYLCIFILYYYFSYFQFCLFYDQAEDVLDYILTTCSMYLD